MNVKAFFKYLNKKINKLEKYVTNPFDTSRNKNPFINYGGETIVWIEKSETNSE